MISKSFSVESGERVLGVIRPSMWTLFPRYLFAGILVVFPFVFFFPLLSLGPFGMGVGALVFMWGGLRLWRTRAQWMNSGLYVTDRRLVDVLVRGRRHFIEELAWRDVDEITLHRSLLNRLVGHGKLCIVGTIDSEVSIEVSHVADAKSVHAFLIEVQCHVTEATFANAL